MLGGEGVQKSDGRNCVVEARRRLGQNSGEPDRFALIESAIEISGKKRRAISTGRLRLLFRRILAARRVDRSAAAVTIAARAGVSPGTSSSRSNASTNEVAPGMGSEVLVMG